MTGPIFGEQVIVTRLTAAGNALVYSTFLGGNLPEECRTIAVLPAGQAIVAGGTLSSNFPSTPGAFDPNHTGNGFEDCYVTRFNASGSALDYSTFVGGGVSDQDDQVNRVRPGPDGSTYITGFTQSTDFPTTAGAFDETYNGGQSDAFVARLNSGATALIFSTFIGGSGLDEGRALVVSATGEAAINGRTQSGNLPYSSGAFDNTYNPGGNPPDDEFVCRLSSSGATRLALTYLGGSAQDVAMGIGYTSTGDVVLSGATLSSDWPTTADAFDVSHNGAKDVTLARLNASCSTLEYSTFIGGTNGDNGEALLPLANDFAIVAGSTNSPEFPTTPGVFDRTYNGDPFDVFVMEFYLGEAVGVAGPGAPREGTGLIVTARPNPCRIGARLEVNIQSAVGGRIEADVFDVGGRRVCRLFRGNVPSGGLTSVEWKGMDERGKPLPSGVYGIVVRGTGDRATRKVCLTR